MTKTLIAYLAGLIFISIGLVPITKNIFAIKNINDAPIFFLVGGIWLLLIIVFIYSAQSLNKSKL
tara:strand:+ start:219 stop:413 length:195 start_codon:yes stop_codon:yes gene_type:complete